MRFLDYISNIETIDDNILDGDGDIIINIEMESSGVSGDGQSHIELPSMECNGDGEQLVYGIIEFPLIEVISNNAIFADIEIPLLETESSAGGMVIGNSSIPILEVEAMGRSGNEGEFILPLSVYGEGNANREYEPC